MRFGFLDSFLEEQNNSIVIYTSLHLKVSFWPRGRTLGGTSAINSLVYHRGGRGDYDKWAELGAKGWDYDSVLPYFLKSESFQSPSFRDSSEFSGLLFLLTSKYV